MHSARRWHLGACRVPSLPERSEVHPPGPAPGAVRWQTPPLFLPCSQPRSRAVFAPGQPPWPERIPWNEDF